MKPSKAETATDPTLKILLEAVSDPHCFYTLQKLETNDVIVIDNIELRSGNRAGVLDKLKHQLIPLLEDNGYVATRNDGETITKGPNFDKLKPYLNNWSFNTP